MSRLTRWFRRSRVERDLDDELAFHVDAHMRELMDEGVAPDEARRRALAAFGGTSPIKEQTRDVRGGRWLHDFGADLRYAARTLRHQLGFAAVAILTLTLGIGANTAIFSMVNAVLLRKLPVGEPDRLVLFTDEVQQGERFSNPFPTGQWHYFSPGAYTAIRSQGWPFESVAAFSSGDFITRVEIPGRQGGRVDLDFVSSNFFDTLGAEPALGRMLVDLDGHPGAAPAAVASDRFWREHLGGDPQAMGRTLRIDGTTFTIVGVMPRAFFSARVDRAPDLWIPLEHRVEPPNPEHYYGLSLIGRLAPGQTPASAQESVTRTVRHYLESRQAAPIDAATRARIDGVFVRMADGSRGISVSRASSSRLLVLLLSAVGVVLLIACANVATLFLGRAAAREREVAVRRAIGASRGRLIRQWLTESLVIGGLGAAAGVLVGRLVAPRLLATFVPPSMPIEADIDGTVLAFTTALTLAACLLFGLAPALTASRVDPIASLRAAGRSVRRRRALGVTEPLVVAQIAMSLVLVLGAALLVRTLLNLQEAPTGLDQERVLLVPINPRYAGYTRYQDVAPLYRQIRDRAAALPGVERVSFSRGFRTSFGHVRIDGYQPAQGESTPADMFLIGPDYSKTVGIPVLRGRDITFDDTVATPLVATVNETFARRYFGGSNPIGRRVIAGNGPGRSYEIVGVVRDAQFRSAREIVTPSFFVAVLQETSSRALDVQFDIRTAGDAHLVAEAVRRTIASINPAITIGDARTMRDDVLATMAPERTAIGFIGAFALLALLVSSVGLYGVVAHGLARRTNEIAVRMALGAARMDVIRLIARETCLRLGLGLVIGIALAQLTSGALANQLFGVEPSDHVSIAAASAILSLVVVMTTIRPLWRAMRTDPVVALRAE